MHNILQNALFFSEKHVVNERKLAALTSAFSSIIPHIKDSASAWEAFANCAPVIFCLDCPHSCTLYVGQVIVPIMQHLDFITKHSDYLEISTHEFAARVKTECQPFRFINPVNVCALIAALGSIKGQRTERSHWFYFSAYAIPQGNTQGILLFYKELFTHTNYLGVVYELDRDKLYHGLQLVYDRVFIREVVGVDSYVAAQPHGTDTILKFTATALLCSVALIDINLISDLLSLNPVSNLLFSMRSRRGGVQPSYTWNVAALQSFSAHLQMYLGSCSPLVAEKLHTCCLSQLATMPLSKVPAPLRPFLVDTVDEEAGKRLYPNILAQADPANEYGESNHSDEPHLLLFVAPTCHNSRNITEYTKQSLSLYSDIMGSKTASAQQTSIDNAPQTIRVLFSPNTPEGAPLYSFIAAVWSSL